ncbi:hypothetical protein [Actinomadura sp. 9N407]|uniref:hypothetical protein n=1 Tax=Actinomadura sp. 9N407 TaxID=3375154 RepID=UPI00378F2D9E
MGETPFESFFHDPRRRGNGRGSGRRPLERSFRCRASLRGHAVAPMAQYEEFVRLHEEISARPGVHARRLWLCGLGAATIVAALMFAGVGLIRGVLGVPMPVFIGSGVGTDAAALAYGLCAIVGALQATALLHLLIGVAERPVRAFVWVGGMAVALATLLPLTLRVPAAAALTTSALHLTGGTALVGLLAAVAPACMHPRRPRQPRNRRRRR